jgi:hypothetical protein
MQTKHLARLNQPCLICLLIQLDTYTPFEL